MRAKGKYVLVRAKTESGVTYGIVTNMLPSRKEPCLMVEPEKVWAHSVEQLRQRLTDMIAVLDTQEAADYFKDFRWSPILLEQARHDWDNPIITEHIPD